MARLIKIGSYVQVTVDKDSGMLVGRKGTVKSIDNSDHIWVAFDNHRIPLPFSRDELKPANRTKIK